MGLSVWGTLVLAYRSKNAYNKKKKCAKRGGDVPKFKEMFSTPKKAALTIACIAVMVAVVIASVALYFIEGAQNQPEPDETAAIGGENAKGFAFVDAEVDPADAAAVSAKYVYWEGQFVYEVEFIAGDTEYQYKIDALDGSVLHKESKTVKGPEESMELSAGIGLEEARAIALADAGLEREQVTFTQAEPLEEFGVSVYAFRFFAGNVEYEYQINAQTGAVYSMGTTTYLGQGAEDAPPSAPAFTEPPGSESDPQPTPTPHRPPASAQPQPSEGVAPPTAGIAPPTANVAPPSGLDMSQGSGQTWISLDAAKQAALTDAGVSEGRVIYQKAKLDYEDGSPVYELEFLAGSREYEYEIDAVTGAVLESSWK